MNTWLEKLAESMKEVEAMPIWLQIVIIAVIALGGIFLLFKGKKVHRPRTVCGSAQHSACVYTVLH